MGDTLSGLLPPRPGVSASIYDQANRPNVALANPLEMAGSAANLTNALNQNRLVQANALRGQLLQQATDPDGRINMLRYNQLASQAGPGMALAMPEGVTQSTEIAGQQQAQALKNLTVQSTALDSLGPNATYGQVNAKLQEGLAGGWLQPAEAHSVLVGMPQGDDPQSAATRSHILQTIGDQVRTASERLQSQYGTPATVQQGGQVQPGAVNPRGGAFNQAGSAVPMTTSPETQAALVTVTNPDGSKSYVPRSSLPNSSGQPPSPLGTGRPPAGSPLLNGNAPPASGQSSPTPPTSNSAGLPLGAPETIAADVGKFKTDQFNIPQGQQNVQSLHKAQIALEASSTGRNSEGVHNMWATLQTLGVPIPAGQATDVSSYDVAHKYLMDYARKSGAAAHSDLQLQTSEGANASTGISNQAALDVVHTNIGRERQAIAQNMEADQTGVGYGAHSSKFSTATDPRGFAIETYKPADLNLNDPKSMVSKMTDTERAKFYKSVGIAQRLKLINPP